jgi:hypothetical protein
LSTKYPEISEKTGFLVAQQHFFDNSASRFTAKKRLARPRVSFLPRSAAFGLIYRKNLEFALRTLVTTFLEISSALEVGAYCYMPLLG